MRSIVAQITRASGGRSGPDDDRPDGESGSEGQYHPSHRCGRRKDRLRQKQVRKNAQLGRRDSLFWLAGFDTGGRMAKTNREFPMMNAATGLKALCVGAAIAAVLTPQYGVLASMKLRVKGNDYSLDTGAGKRTRPVRS
jgi:hypothetical protein